MSEIRTHFTLNNGQRIPAVGFGTWKAEPGAAGKAVKLALDAGYRHFVRGKENREDQQLTSLGLCTPV